MMALPTPEPFEIAIDDSFLAFVQNRVETGRIPEGYNFPPGKEWTYGVPPEEMKRLKEYWLNKYDWRAVEARINAHLKMFTVPIDHGEEIFKMHFVHHRSEKEGAVPMLFQHGWPGSFLEVSWIT
jgi:hypothetical protein